MRRVTAIRNGTVIDIFLGNGISITNFQCVEDEQTISLVMNVPSRKLGTKDILKIMIENYHKKN